MPGFVSLCLCQECGSARKPVQQKPDFVRFGFHDLRHLFVVRELHAVHEAGDHFIVFGKVHSLDAAHSRKPLLFFQGTYGGFT